MKKHSIASQVYKTSPFNRLGIVLAGMLILNAMSPSAKAATNYFSGSGTWDNGVTADWSTTGSAPYNSVWTNSTTTQATFQGTAGTVTVSGDIVIYRLQFSTDGYTLNGGTIDIAANNVYTNGGTDTINSVINVGASGGGELFKENAGTLILGGVNLYTSTQIDAGTIKLSGAGTLGTTNGTLYVNTSGTLDLGGTNQTVDWLGGAGAILNSNVGTTSTLTVGNANGSSVFSGTIKDNAGTGGVVALTKVGTGQETLSSANTFTGTTTVSAGVLILNNSLALQDSTVNTSAGGTLDLNGITVATFGGLTGSTNLATFISVGYTTFTTALTLNPVTGVSDTYSGIIANGKAGMTVTKTGSGTQILAGPNTFTGGLIIKQGTLGVGVSNNGALSGAAGVTTAATTLGDTTGSVNASLLTEGAYTFANAINVASGSTGNTLSIGGATDNNSTFSGLVTLNNNLTVSQVANTGSNALNVTGGITGGTNGTQTVTFAGPGNINVFTTGISDNTSSNKVAVNLTGGLLNLAVGSTYSGGTTVTSGVLKVNNASGSATGTGAVDVKSGATVSGGNDPGTALSGPFAGGASYGTYASGKGSIGGSLNIESGANLTPGNNNVGTLTTASLTLNSGSIANYDFNTANKANDFTLVTGALTFNTGGGAAGFNLFDDITKAAFTQAGLYDLIGYSTSDANIIGLTGAQLNTDLAVLNQQSGFTYTFINDTADGLIQLQIVQSVPEPGTWALLIAGFGLLIVIAKRRHNKQA